MSSIDNLHDIDLISEPGSNDSTEVPNSFIVDTPMSDNIPEGTILPDMSVSRMPSIAPTTRRKRARPQIESDDESEISAAQRQRLTPYLSEPSLPAAQIVTPPIAITAESPSTIHKINVPDSVAGEEKTTIDTKTGKKKTFSLRARYIFLTYPQCNLSVENFQLLLREWNHQFIRLIACREYHENGTDTHFHVLGDLGVSGAGNNPPHIRTERAFDIGGRKYGRPRVLETTETDEDGREILPVWHPNIRAVKSIDNAWHYINKRVKGNETVWGQFQDPCLERKSGVHNQGVWHAILEESTWRTNFLENIAKRDPRTLATSFGNTQKFAEDRFPKEEKPAIWPGAHIRHIKPWAKIDIIERWKKMFLKRKYLGRQISLWIMAKARLENRTMSRQWDRTLRSKRNSDQGTYTQTSTSYT